MGSDEPPFLTSCLVLSLYSSVKSRLHRTPMSLASYSTKASVFSSPTWTFLSEYLVDLKSWSTRPRTRNLARNGCGQRPKWAWFKNSHALCTHNVKVRTPL